MRTSNEIADDLATEIKGAMESLESVYSLIPRLLRGKVDKKKERIAELLAEYEQAKNASRHAKEPKRYGSLKECLRDLLMDEDGLNIYNITYAKKWPNVKGEEEDDEPEPMDLENYELLELTDTKFRMCGGGDWQPETTVELELVDGQLTVTKVESAYEEGMDVDEFIELLKA